MAKTAPTTNPITPFIMCPAAHGWVSLTPSQKHGLPLLGVAASSSLHRDTILGKKLKHTILVTIAPTTHNPHRTYLLPSNTSPILATGLFTMPRSPMRPAFSPPSMPLAGKILTPIPPSPLAWLTLFPLYTRPQPPLRARLHLPCLPPLMMNILSYPVSPVACIHRHPHLPVFTCPPRPWIS